MKKTLLSLVLIAGLSADELLVIDPDKNGTNIRELPKGKVIAKIPYVKASDERARELRTIKISGAVGGGWFMVGYGQNYEKYGYMHKSVLGSCASGTEDGEAVLMNDKGKAIAKIGGALVRLEDIKYENGKDIVYKVSLKNKKGKKLVGWIYPNALFNDPSYCKAWE